MFNLMKFFKDKTQAFRVARIAGYFREIASLKGGRHRRKDRKTAEQKAAYREQKYRPGKTKLPLSEASAAIRKDYDGMILSRKERKERDGAGFNRYYFGEGPQRHGSKPRKQSRGRRS